MSFYQELKFRVRVIREASQLKNPVLLQKYQEETGDLRLSNKQDLSFEKLSKARESFNGFLTDTNDALSVAIIIIGESKFNTIEEKCQTWGDDVIHELEACFQNLSDEKQTILKYNVDVDVKKICRLIVIIRRSGYELCDCVLSGTIK